MMLFLQKMFAQFFFLLIMFHYKIEELLWRVLNDDNIVGLFHVLLLLHKYSRYDSHLNEEYRNTPKESTESEREPRSELPDQFIYGMKDKLSSPSTLALCGLRHLGSGENLGVHPLEDVAVALGSDASASVVGRLHITFALLL